MLEFTERAEQAKELAINHFDLAKKLFKEESYYDWIVVILFYAACTLMTSVCCLEKIPEPREHKGRYDNNKKIYIDGMLDKVKKYLGNKAHKTYSFLLVQSQLMRYYPEYALKFKKDTKSKEVLKKIYFGEFRIFVDEFKQKYGKKLK